MNSAEMSRVEVTDEELLQRYYDGEEFAFEAVVKRYGARLHRFVRCIIGDDAEAWDLLQEMWCSIVTKRPTPENVRYLLYQKCSWLALDQIRTRTRRKTDQADETLDQMPSTVGSGRILDRLTLGTLLNTVSVEERHVVALRLDGFGNGDIAGMLRISDGHASNLFRSATEKMSRAWEANNE